MATQAMQEYCLAIMGIKQWQLKTIIKRSYLLLLDEMLNDEKNQLLTRLLQAMKWQGAADIVVAQDMTNQQLIEKITLKQVSKVVLFGEALAQRFKVADQAVTVVSVPSVADMLVNVQAKKNAWLILKSIR